MPTVTSDTAICNMALLDLGHQKITAIGEATTAGEMCEIYYGPTRDALLNAPLEFCCQARNAGRTKHGSQSRIRLRLSASR